MNVKRLPRTVGAMLAVTAGLLLASANPAAAGPSGNASCLGHEAAGISPPGSSEEFPGGMPQLMSTVRGFDGPPGAFISSAAHRHAGSHEACDAGE